MNDLVLSGNRSVLGQIPTAVANCVDGLSDVQDAVERLNELADESASLARQAQSVQLNWWKIGDKAEAIRALQSAVTSMAQTQNSQALTATKMLEYQSKITVAVRALFGMGVANLKANRQIVQKLRESKVEMGDLAKAEVDATIAQLEAHERVLVQQDELRKTVLEFKKQIPLVLKRLDTLEREVSRLRGVRSSVRPRQQSVRQEGAVSKVISGFVSLFRRRT